MGTAAGAGAGAGVGAGALGPADVFRMESTREGPRVNAEALDDVSSKIADSEVGLARVAAVPSALLVTFLSLMPGGYPVGEAEFSVCLAATAAADGLSRAAA